jgi:hypothetical protein
MIKTSMPASWAFVIANITDAPIKVIVARVAIEAVDPTKFSTIAASTVRRDNTSPVLTRVK